MDWHEAETKTLKMAAWLLKEKCLTENDGECECCPFSLWFDAGAECVFGERKPDEWNLELLESRKTWPEDEDLRKDD